MHIVLSGPPGSGKGTQAELLIAKTGLAHYSTGDVFRDLIRRKTPIGIKVQEYVASGRLVPDEIVLEVAREFLSSLNRQDAKTAKPSFVIRHSSIANNQGVLFDGFPRTLPQAEGLDRILAESSSGIDRAVFIDLAEEVIIQRLTSRRTCRKCGAIYNLDFKPPRQAGSCDLCGGELFQRDDDQEVTIRNRLRVYERETAGLKDYYARQQKLSVLDGSIGKDRLHAEIMKLVGALQTADCGLRNVGN